MVRSVKEKESYTADTAAGEGDLSVDEEGAQQDNQTQSNESQNESQ